MKSGAVAKPSSPRSPSVEISVDTSRNGVTATAPVSGFSMWIRPPLRTTNTRPVPSGIGARNNGSARPLATRRTW
jgi:hypothetical protein